MLKVLTDVSKFSFSWDLFQNLLIFSLFLGDDDDEDAPMISGFSDDVPMVIA